MIETTNTVLNLFPIPVFVSENFPIDSGVLDKVQEYDKKLIDSSNTMSSLRSTDTFVLRKDELSPLAAFINNYLHHYTRNVMSFDRSVRFYITQSWIEYSRQNQIVPPRATQNSIFSGLFVLSDSMETFTFVKPTPVPPTIEGTVFTFKLSEPNPYNGGYNDITVEKNKLMLFPSNMGVFCPNHLDTRYTRVVLRFNVFFDGVLGSDLDQLDYLSITGNHD